MPTLLMCFLISCGSATAEDFKPTRSDAIVKSDTEWREALSIAAYRILRKGGTEQAFTGQYWDNKADGMYRCGGCGLTLFSSETKYKSGTGWPSFSDTAAPDRVGTRTDRGMGMPRTEILCNRCGGHLGHVFSDGPAPTGLRYCVNGDALQFTAAEPESPAKQEAK